MMRHAGRRADPLLTDLTDRTVIDVTRARARTRTVETDASVRSVRTAEHHGLSTLLALDLGQSTGWALRGADGAMASGTMTFRPGRFEGAGMAFLRFKHWLQEVNVSTPLDIVFFEEVRRHAGTTAGHVYGGFLAHLAAWCEHHAVPYQGVPVGTIKRHVAGRGNADKQAVIAAIRARGFAPADDNEADALAILLWAIETQGGVR